FSSLRQLTQYRLVTELNAVKRADGDDTAAMPGTQVMQTANEYRARGSHRAAKLPRLGVKTNAGIYGSRHKHHTLQRVCYTVTDGGSASGGPRQPAVPEDKPGTLPHTAQPGALPAAASPIQTNRSRPGASPAMSAPLPSWQAHSAISASTSRTRADRRRCGAG